MEEKLPQLEDVRGILGELPDGMSPEEYVEYRYHGEYIDKIKALERQLAEAQAGEAALQQALQRAHSRIAHYCAFCKSLGGTVTCSCCDLAATRADVDLQSCDAGRAHLEADAAKTEARRLQAQLADCEADRRTMAEALQLSAARAERMRAELAEAQADAASLLDAIEAKEQLLACYRLGKQPSERLWKRLEKANRAMHFVAAREWLELARDMAALLANDDVLDAKVIYCPWCARALLLGQPNDGHAEDCRLLDVRARAKAAGLLPAEDGQ
jgi:hypothetical protein